MVKKLNLRPEEDFSLLGIASSTKDYQLCFEINKWLNMNFTKEEDHEIFTDNENTPSAFSTYFFDNETEGSELYLFTNKGSSAYLIPEYKNLDFFLLIKGNIYDEEKAELIHTMKKLPSIQGIYEIETAKLKSKQNLIF